MAEPLPLSELQRWLSRVVCDPRQAEVAITGPSVEKWITAERVRNGEIVLPCATMDPPTRIDVYGGGYLARLIGVLRSDFPGLVHALGDEGFYQLAEAYLTQHPSQHPNLLFLARYLPNFLAARVSEFDHGAFLHDLATVELAVTEAFHADQAPPFDPASLSHLAPEDWDDVVLHTSPSLRILAMDYPANGYLQAVFNGEQPEVPAPARSYLAVYRKEFKVWRAKLTERGHATLSALAAGRRFGEALECAGEEADRVGAWFQDWTADALFCE